MIYSRKVIKNVDFKIFLSCQKTVILSEDFVVGNPWKKIHFQLLGLKLKNFFSGVFGPEF